VIHTDASQSVGKIVTDVRALHVDLLTVAGHKLYATKGCGALYKRASLRLEKLIHGANHERGFRAGTENVMQVVALGQACVLARERQRHAYTHNGEMRDRLRDLLRGEFDADAMRVNNHPEHSLPNTLSVSFRGVLSSQVLSELADQVAASSGSACHSGKVHISPVLRAMGLTAEWAAGTFRFSVGVPTTADEVDRAALLVCRAIRAKLSSNSPGRE
jgi:cysteine desulfurase